MHLKAPNLAIMPIQCHLKDRLLFQKILSRCLNNPFHFFLILEKISHENCGTHTPCPFASLLARSWPPLPSIAFPDLAQH